MLLRRLPAGAAGRCGISFCRGFVVSFLGRNSFHPQMLHDRVIQRLVAVLLADLNHAGNLVGLAFAHEVRDGRGEHENFQRGHAAFFIDALEKILRDDAFERFRKRRADFVLLFGRENVDDTIDGLGGARRVQRAENQVTGAGGYERQFDGFQIAQLADQNDVRVFAQRAAQRGGERLRCARRLRDDSPGSSCFRARIRSGPRP